MELLGSVTECKASPATTDKSRLTNTRQYDSRDRINVFRSGQCCHYNLPSTFANIAAAAAYLLPLHFLSSSSFVPVLLYPSLAPGPRRPTFYNTPHPTVMPSLSLTANRQYRSPTFSASASTSVWPRPCSCPCFGDQPMRPSCW